MNNRYARQKDLVPGDKIKDIQITVIGTGAIGRQCSIQLATMGAVNLNIIDFDTVEEANLGAQGFYEQDLKKQKVEAVKEVCQQINSSCVINAINAKFNKFMDLGINNVVFCCVDSIDTRKQIFEAIGNQVRLFIDGRMSAEFGRVFCVFDEKSNDFYKTQLFPQREAFNGSCTAKTTIYASNIISGWMVSQFAKWLRGIELDSGVDINILTNEIKAYNK